MHLCLCFQHVIFIIVKCLSVETFHENVHSHTLPLHSAAFPPVKRPTLTESSSWKKRVWSQTLKTAFYSAVIFGDQNLRFTNMKCITVSVIMPGSTLSIAPDFFMLSIVQTNKSQRAFSKDKKSKGMKTSRWNSTDRYSWHCPQLWSSLTYIFLTDIMTITVNLKFCKVTFLFFKLTQFLPSKNIKMEGEKKN